MTAVEQRATLLAEGAASPDLVPRLLAALVDTLDVLREDLKRREARRREEAGQPSRAPAQQPAPSSGAVFPNYGKAKNQPIVGASMQDLEYYAAGARRSLADASKSRWHDKERALLGAIEAEIARQRGGAPTGNTATQSVLAGAPEFGPGGSDEEIPF